MAPTPDTDEKESPLRYHLLKGDADEEQAMQIEKEKEESSLRNSLIILSYFGVWYTINVGYNIFVKSVLNEIPLYNLVAGVQLSVGCTYILCVWGLGLRKAPVLNRDEIKRLLPIGMCHAVGHLAAVLSLGTGAVSFTHIVKSGEPVFTATLSALVLKQYFRWPVYATLIPIIAGVSLASLKELDFSWWSFAGAMTSNLTSAIRAILSKKMMDKPLGKNMTPANLYGVVSLMSFCFAFPIALMTEGWKARSVYIDSFGADEDNTRELKAWGTCIIGGLSFYLYNEVAFLALSKVHPITHAVANTIKRVVIIVVTCIVFGNKITSLGAVGCTIAITGTLLYSLFKIVFKRQ